jgi:hypothetical protein
MLDRSMAEPVLYRPGVVAGIGQGVAAAVAQHMDVNREGQPGADADRLNLTVDGIGREWSAALSGEDERGVRELPAQLA